MRACQPRPTGHGCRRATADLPGRIAAGGPRDPPGGRSRLEPVAEGKISRLLTEAEDDLIDLYAMPTEHWSKLRSTKPLERFNREIARRSDVVGIYPNNAALIRLAASLLIEQTTNGSSAAGT